MATGARRRGTQTVMAATSTLARPASDGAPSVAFEDSPLRAFHVRIALASTGGVFSDGFGLGIIGIALSLATPQLGLTPAWSGLLAGASLAGLFAGALLTGPFADRYGRRPVFRSNMAVLALLSAGQFLAANPAQLLVLRLAIGFVLGTDYVVSKAMLVEYTPRKLRGRILSTLSVAWASGYASAYFVGYALGSPDPDAWRWILLTSAVPCLLILPLRVTLPESALWLVNHGHHEAAAEIVRAALGAGVRPPERVIVAPRPQTRWQQLLSPLWRRRTLVGCLFFTCQVIPYFAIGTFIAQILTALSLEGSRAGGLLYNAALLAGSILGIAIVDRVPRRSFLAGTFWPAAAALLALSTLPNLGPVAMIALFAIFAGAVSAASNLCYVYLPELFPTDLRASGIGLAIAASRLGSAASTFGLPLVVAHYGPRTALGACVAVLVAGAAGCQLWAPETRHQSLNATDPAQQA